MYYTYIQKTPKKQKHVWFQNRWHLSKTNLVVFWLGCRYDWLTVQAVLGPDRYGKYVQGMKGMSVNLLGHKQSMMLWHEKCFVLTHWGRVTHICVGKLTIIGSDNGLSPERRQATIWTNAGILLTGPLGTNFSDILIEIQTFSFKKIRLKMSSAKCCSFCLGLNVLMALCDGKPLVNDGPPYQISTNMWFWCFRFVNMKMCWTHSRVVG